MANQERLEDIHLRGLDEPRNGYGWPPLYSHRYSPPLRTGADHKLYLRQSLATFLRLLIGPNAEVPRISVHGLDRELHRIRPQRTFQRSQIYSYLSAEVLPKPALTWDIATAIRTFGRPWAHGPVMLVAAGHYVDFFGVVANLERGPDGLLFESLANIADVVPSAIIYGGSDETELTRQLLRPASGPYVECEYIAAGRSIEIAWERWVSAKCRFKDRNAHLVKAARWLETAEIDVSLRSNVLRSITMDCLAARS